MQRHKTPLQTDVSAIDQEVHLWPWHRDVGISHVHSGRGTPQQIRIQDVDALPANTLMQVDP